MKDLKDEIHSRVDVISLIGGSIALKTNGTHAVGLCPFHDEKTPSFYVYKDHYHCFGCSAHGDAISFIRKIHGLAFIDSLKWLAEKYNLSTESLNYGLNQTKQWQEKRRIKTVLLEAQKFFHATLTSSNLNHTSWEYLKKRGISDKIVMSLGLGYAPANNSSLYNKLKKNGYSDYELCESSLINKGGNRFYDFFQNRIIFPIHDEQGRLVAFSGRAIGKNDYPKYKNSRFDKSSFLYGLNQAKTAIMKSKRVILVEGHLDAVQMWNYGFNEAIASQGTAVTTKHLGKLNSWARKITLLFDGDTAGKTAALKVLEHSFSFPNLHFEICFLPAKEDPDSFLKKNGPEALEKVLNNPEDLLQFAIREKIETAPKTGLAGVLREDIHPWIQNIKDPLLQESILNVAAKVAGIETRVLKTQFYQQKNKVKDKNLQTPKKISSDHIRNVEPKGLEREFLAHLYFSKPDKIDLNEVDSIMQEFVELVGVWCLWSKELKAALRVGKAPAELPLETWTATAFPEISKFIEVITIKSRAYHSADKIDTFAYFKLEFEKRRLLELLKNLKSEVLSLQMSGNDFGSGIGVKVTHSVIQTTQELEIIDKRLRNYT